MRYSACLLVLMSSSLLTGGTFAAENAFHDPAVVKLPAPPGVRVLLYPGGQYGRIIPWGLKQPGADMAPVHLHRPRQATIHLHRPYTAEAPHRLVLHKPVHHTPAHPATASAWNPPKPPKRPRPPQLRVKVPPKAAPNPVVKPVTHVAKVTPKPKPAHKHPHKTVQVARAEPAPRQTRTPFYAHKPHAGRRLAQIAFLQSASQLIPSEIDRLNILAKKLNHSISMRDRVQILAYAGPKNSKTSSARRLSLKRALIVRQLLIDGGISADRIDVRAMGGVTDNGAHERVDIFVKH